MKTNENDRKSEKQTKKKLRLAKETRRTLSDGELHGVVGGLSSYCPHGRTGTCPTVVA